MFLHRPIANIPLTRYRVLLNCATFLNYLNEAFSIDDLHASDLIFFVVFIFRRFFWINNERRNVERSEPTSPFQIVSYSMTYFRVISKELQKADDIDQRNLLFVCYIFSIAAVQTFNSFISRPNVFQWLLVKTPTDSMSKI